MRRGRRRLHEQGLGQLALVLLDLLLQVSDCARNLAAETPVSGVETPRVGLHRFHARATPAWADPLPGPGPAKTGARASGR